ncbi:MAG: squalene/phytoene synthase family protein [Ignavibacteria bacterium]|nr:squalene/phytoene synthase family protein [Ignavibacteria bacterium]
MKLITKSTFADIEHIPNISSEKSNFRFAFNILPRDKRIAITAFYSFCSYIDDIVDEADIEQIEKQNRLAFWKESIASMYGENVLPTLTDFWDIISHYSIPQSNFNILIDGIDRDLHQHTYADEEDLLSYCYGVASIVGLSCLHIFTDNHITEDMRQYAINLGYALQLSNIIRDVVSDAQRNYCYIPLSDLQQYDYSFDDILNFRYTTHFIALMEHQYLRAIKYYDIANSYLANIPDKSQFKSPEMMRAIYYAILQKIKQRKYNIFEGKTKLTKYEKLKVILQK